MRILEKKLREGRIRLRPESLDDLWELSHIIGPGDGARAHTERKLAVGGDRAKQVRKPMTLTIEVSEVALEHDILRIQGTITEGPEDLISYGDHHSLAISTGTDIEIRKEWDALTLDRLERAAKAEPLDILLVTFDRESAFLAELTRRGYDVVQTITGDVAKKAPGGGSEDFWHTLAGAITELDRRRGYNAIVAASPAFWTDYLYRALPADVQRKTKTASCSAVGEAALSEVMRRPELTELLEQDRTSSEERVVQDVLEALGRDKACYGMEDCAERAMLGQVSLLIVSEELIAQAREAGTFREIDAVLEQVKGTGGEIRLIEHVTKQLDAIGGIAGVLRW